MIQVNAPNIVTIVLCGALGYALLAGIPKLRGVISSGASGVATATA